MVLAVLTDNGREYLIDAMVNGTAPVLSYFKVGTGGVGHTPTEAQSALETEISIEFTNVVLSKISQKVMQVVCSLPQVAGFEDTISEIGLFTDSDALFAYGVFSPRTKDNSNEFVGTFTVQI